MSRRGPWTCRCGALLESQEALIDHRAWCAGTAGDNAQLIREAAARAGEVSYEALVALAREHRASRDEPA